VAVVILHVHKYEKK